MKRSVSVFSLLVLLVGAAATLAAQSSTQPPPKVLVVSREYLKPGKGGSPHQKTESAFVQAMAAARWPTHYIGTDAMTGVNRSVFFTGYDSMDAWGKDMAATYGNTKLATALDHAFIADGELLTETDTNVFTYREDLSLNANVDIAHMRYFEVSIFKAKPGHEMEWEAIAKMYVDNYPKANPAGHWATFQQAYGAHSGGVYVVIIPMKSLAEIDAGMASDKKFYEALGESGMKKMMELSAASTDSIESQVLIFNPAMSYVGDDWIKADPGFWKPKPAAAAPKAAAAPEAKPAQ
ncbi:MAG TPA: hypothetical protein VE779_05065 [Candidatus Angelobacter sp.]|nr:hypothetical protein [Candidatus Angelobacter sp.]